jgi:two-component system, cell cycle sensor histidine kinase and response regulator CckA
MSQNANGDEVMNSAKRIMIVEDDGIIAMHLQELLQKSGYAVIAVVASGEAALQKANDLFPELILMDIHLSGGWDGIETARRIQDIHDIPIIYLSAFADDELVEQAKKTTPYAYLTKPIRERELQIAIQITFYNHDLEKRLKESEARYHGIFEGVHDAIFVETLDGIILEANEEACRMYGFSYEQFIHKPVKDLIPPNQLNALTDQDQIPIFSKKTIQASNLRSNGEAFPVEITIQRQIIDGKSVFLVVVRDITERKRLEMELLAAQKLAHLGTLAAGIAHEMNTPLQIITGLSATALEKLEKETINPSQIMRNLKSINQNAWRLAEYILALRTYAEATSIRVEAHDFNRLVMGTTHLMEDSLQERWITLKTQYGENFPPIFCDADKITQVIVQLLNNARDALPPENGTITIITGFRNADRQFVLQVCDNGKGISPEIQERIFDPFFTTKAVGSGTGLGLSIVLGIVNAHGGKISFKSSPGKGTTFTILLPIEPPFESKVEKDEGPGRYDQ